MPEWLGANYNAGIETRIDNFLPACTLIYYFLSSINDTSDGFYIEANESKKLFDFTGKLDFINFMYRAWESKIDSMYKRMGGIVLDNKNHYKMRCKVDDWPYRKYLKKIVM